MYHCIAHSADRPKVELIWFSIIDFESDLTKSIGMTYILKEEYLHRDLLKLN